jgi:FkbM family methyltransferase
MLNKIILNILKSILDKKSAVNLISYLSDNFNINLNVLNHNRSGILNYQNEIVSGEKYFIEVYLKKYFKDKKMYDELILLDVGANIGKYTSSLITSFPKANIFTFEPNLKSYNVLKDKIRTNGNNKVHLCPIGLSSEKCDLQMTTYADDTKSSHTSLHSKIFTDFHKSKNNISFLAKFTTLDLFCSENKINHIDLLKIDTEGHEMEVLKGAQKLLLDGKIKIIQFEFGECNVYTRVFLKDFYDLLIGFKFYRLLPNDILPLGNHTPANEIFQFQNIIAIHD